VIAGLDEIGGGSWLGLNPEGVVAAVLNREGTLGQMPGKRSRGELVLEALDHPDAAPAADALAGIDPAAYRPFNLVVADDRDAVWLANDGRRITVQPIAPGLHMLSARSLDDLGSPRLVRYLPRFAALAPPRPDPTDDQGGDWGGWPALMGDVGEDLSDGEESAAMCFICPNGFGTVSSSLIALPATGQAPARPVWRFAAGRPDRTVFSPVRLV
jgi:hypothetical protein